MRDDDGDLQLADLLDHSFGAGPDGLPTPSERLTAGREALRRRHRMGIAGVTGAVVAVFAVGVALSGAVGDGPDAADPLPPLATMETTASAAPSPDATSTTTTDLTTTGLERALERLSRKARERAHRIEQRLVDDEFPASFGQDRDSIVLKDGWQIVQRVEEPMGFAPPEASLGVVVTDGDRTRWMLLTLEHQVDEQGDPTGALGSTAAADDPGAGYSRFEDWLASMVELNTGTPTPPLVTVDEADRLRPGPGAELVETRPAPVIDGYTTDGDRMAKLLRKGRTWFVVVRGHGPQADVIPVDAGVLSAPTFEALVAHVTSQADSGAGLR